MPGSYLNLAGQHGIETFRFEYTETKTVSMVKRYFQYFQRKLTLLGLQVADLCEQINKDETMRTKFSGESANMSLHHSIDKFLMGLLKGFLQNIDEGFADIIDELEDYCSDDHYSQSILKRVVFEFQQNSFSKRQELAQEYEEENEEIGKPSYAWFDTFFGDVTTLLKNPISRNAYQTQVSKPNHQHIANNPQFYPVVPKAYPLWQSSQQVWNLKPQEDQLDDGIDKSSKASSLEFDWDKKIRNWGSGDSLAEMKPSEPENWQVNFNNMEKPPQSTKSSTLSKSEQPGDQEGSRPVDQSTPVQIHSPYVNFEDMFEREVFNIDQSPVYCVCQNDANSILVATTKEKLYKYHTDQRRLETVFDGRLVLLNLEGQCVFDIKLDYEGRIAFADSDNIYLITDVADESRLINLGSYSTCKCCLNQMTLDYASR
jgi:hypothetical protein